MRPFAPATCERTESVHEAPLFPEGLLIFGAHEMISLEQLPKFPCHWSNKKPLTEHGFYDARIDVDDRSWPLAGVPGSAMSGFDFLDIDPRNGGHRWLAENEHRLPVTRVHHTRGGGWHYLFRYAGVRLRKEIASGVECKGDGGKTADRHDESPK